MCFFPCGCNSNYSTTNTITYVPGPTGPIGPVGPRGPQGEQGPAGTITPGVAVAQLAATATLSEVITQFNALITSLTNAGFLA